MSTILLGEIISRILLFILPSRYATRIRSNCSERPIYILRTSQTIHKTRMSNVEGPFATILFDLALFGTDNFFINFMIRTFTKLQNSWNRPFANREVARKSVMEFCIKLGVKNDGKWIWDRPMEEYQSLNDFFSRRYHPDHKPPLGKSDVVSPACCLLSCYQNEEGLRSLLIKGCDFRLERVGLWPMNDWRLYARHSVLIGYLSPPDYHRVHSPIAGKVVHVKMESEDAASASVKFFDGRFNILNENKRLVVVIENGEEGKGEEPPLRVALVIVGGVGVNTISYDLESLLNKDIQKGEEISTFLAGGSAFAMFSNRKLFYDKELLDANEKGMPVEVMFGESIGSFR